MANRMNIPDAIPLVDLTAQYESIRQEIDRAIAGVIRDTAFISGPYVASFEKEFASYCGVPHSIGVSNGTDALRLALLGCGVRPGDEVLTVPNTFIATAEAVGMIGASVRFVDVDPNTNTIDATALERALTPKTKAVIPVHLYGRPADMDPILKLAAAKGIRVIGDAAQAHGALYGGRPISALGDAVCFSFYPGKNLGAYGDAGAVVTKDAAVAQRVRMLRDHGRTKKYEHDVEGFNCRMDGIQAAILSVKLKRLEAWTERRRTLAAQYNALLQDLPDLRLPTETPGSRSVYHLYAIRTAKRDQLLAGLSKAGIGAGIHYPIPLHLQPAYKHLGYRLGSFPNAEAQSRETLSLPLYPEMTDAQVIRVADSVRAVLAGSALVAD